MRDFISKNETCPCNSGEKYKHCTCYENGLKLKFLPMKIYGEDYVLKNLLKNSLFKKYFTSIKSQIKLPLIWCLDKNIHSRMRNQTLLIGEQQTPSVFLILSKNMPITTDFTFDTAHELQHLILTQEGFPGTIVKDIYQNNSFYLDISASLGSMVTDPIINTRLLKLGFNFDEHYDRAINTLYDAISKHPLPKTLHEKAYWIFSFINRSLDCEKMTNKVKKDNFFKWYEQHHSIIFPEAKEILSFVKNIGYDTPEKMNTIYIEILNRYNLNDIMEPHVLKI